jgi:tripeptidyl-peptidase I
VAICRCASRLYLVSLCSYYLVIDEVKSFVQPSNATVAAFNAFANANNLQVSAVSPNGDWVSFTTTVGHANTLFGASFETFTHQAMAEPLTRTLFMSLPEELVGHVDTIHPSTSFDVPDPRLAPFVVPIPAKRDIPTSCNSTITPSCLQDIYGIPATPAKENSSTLLVTGYAGQFAQTADLVASILFASPKWRSMLISLPVFPQSDSS